MSILPRPEIDSVPPVVHGGFHNTHQDDWLDFSSNVNPFGPSMQIWDALRAAPIGRHPDPRATPLRHALTEIESIGADRLIVGNGSVDLIYHLAVAFLRPGDTVLIIAPTFGEYAAACAIMGAHTVFYRTQPENDFDINVDALLAQARTSHPRLIFLCNPNNPTGKYVSRIVVEKISLACPDSLLVLDQAFVRFIPDAWDSRPLHNLDNLLILRSLTKDYALTGLRVGYAMASPAIIEALEKVQPPWSVNIFAQVATIAALSDEQHLRHSLAALERIKYNLIADLSRLGMSIVPSATNFFLAQVTCAETFTRQLRDHKIVVRDCTSFGLPEHVRIATRLPEENGRLVRAVEAIR